MPPVGGAGAASNYYYAGNRWSAAGVGGSVEFGIPGETAPWATGNSHSMMELGFFSGTDARQSIEVGWTDDTSLDIDPHPHLFVYANKNGYAGSPDCYNCSFVPRAGAGFVPGQSLDTPSANFYDAPTVTSKFALKFENGNWWVWFASEWIGYIKGDFWENQFTSAPIQEVWGEVYDEGNTYTDMGDGFYGTSPDGLLVRNPTVYPTLGTSVEERLPAGGANKVTNSSYYDVGEESNCNDQGCRSWRVGGPGKGPLFNLVTEPGGKCLYTYSSSHENGVGYGVSECTNAANQQIYRSWPSGYLIMKHSKKCIEAPVTKGQTELLRQEPCGFNPEAPGWYDPQSWRFPLQSPDGREGGVGSVSTVQDGGPTSGQTPCKDWQEPDGLCHAHLSMCMEVGQPSPERPSAPVLETSCPGTSDPQWRSVNVFAGKEVPLPQVGTVAATEIHGTSAKLNAMVNSEGLQTGAYFAWSDTDEALLRVPFAPPIQVGNGTQSAPFSVTLSNLKPKTKYVFQAYAENAGGIVRGETLSFTTKSAPGVGTGTPREVTSTSAYIGGGVNPEGYPATGYIEFGPTTSYGTKLALTSVGSGKEAVGIGQLMTGLEPGSTYHYRVVAEYEEGVIDGSDMTLTTPNATLASAGTVGTGGMGEGQFSHPAGSAIDANGDLWVVDQGNNRVEEFNEKGEFLKKIGATILNRPSDIAIDNEGNLWVTDTGNGRVVKFAPSGGFLGAYGSYGREEDQFVQPEAIAADPSGGVWVVDDSNRGLRKLSASGQFKESVNPAAIVNGLAVSPTGMLWVSTSNNSIEELSRTGQVEVKFGSSGSEPGQLSRPEALDVDQVGDVWVVDAGNQRIERFDESGNFLLEFGHEAGFSFSVPIPTGISVSKRFVWVSDTENNRVQKWSITAPGATTEPATAVRGVTATFHGIVNPEGSASSYYFEYGHDVGEKLTNGMRVPVTPVAVGSGTAPISVSTEVSGLDSGTYYAYRLIAVSATGRTRGGTVIFHTLSKPVVSKEAATGVMARSASLNGSVDPEGLPTTYWFEYGPTTAYGSSVPTTPQSVGSGTSGISVSQELAGLEEWTTYHYRLVARSEAGTTYGADKSFTTPLLPNAKSEAAFALTSTGAGLSGFVNPQNSPTTWWFEYGPTGAYGSRTESGSLAANVTWTAVTRELTGLTPGATYHFRVVAQSQTGTAYGADQTFKAEPFLQNRLRLTPAIERFDGSSGSLERFASKWSPLGWANGAPAKGEDSTSGWRAVAQTPAVTGAYLSQPFAAAPGGLAVSAEMAADPGCGTCYFSLWLDMPTPGSAAKSGYQLEVIKQAVLSSNYEVQLVRWQSGVAKVLASENLLELGAGTAFALFDEGERLSAWAGAGNRFRQVLTAADATYSAGSIGLEASSVSTATGQNAVRLANLAAGVPVAAPLATSEAPTEVKGISATINGVVRPEGAETTWYFEFGETASYNNGAKVPATAQSAGSGSGAVPVSVPLALHGSTTYHYRLVAQSPSGTSYGADRSFTTPAALSTPALSAAEIKAEGATLKGEVKPAGRPATYWFEYKPVVSISEASSPWAGKVPVTPASAGSGTTAVPVTQALTGLQEFTEYRYRLVVSDSVETVTSNTGTFKTTTSFKAQTYGVQEVKATSALVGGFVGTGGASTEYFFEYGPTTAYGSKAPAAGRTIATGGEFGETLTGLTAGTVYHYRVVVKSEGKTAYGVDRSFRAEAPTLPTRLAGLAVGEPFDGSSASLERFASGWGTLGWATAIPAKGVDSTTGWHPEGSGLAGAYRTQALAPSASALTVEATLASRLGCIGCHVSLWLDTPTPGGTEAGYELRITKIPTLETAAYELTLSRWQGGVRTELATRRRCTLPIGTPVAFADEGGALTAWFKSGTEWYEAVAGFDGTLTSGYAGLEASDPSAVVTNFGAGVVP